MQALQAIAQRLQRLQRLQSLQSLQSLDLLIEAPSPVARDPPPDASHLLLVES